MRGKIGTILILSLLVLAVASCGCAEDTGQQAVLNSSTELQNSGNVQITDMLGRQLTVPAEISSVVATSPPSTILVYMLAPEKLAGWNFKNNFTISKEFFYDIFFVNTDYGIFCANKANIC